MNTLPIVTPPRNLINPHQAPTPFLDIPPPPTVLTRSNVELNIANNTIRLLDSPSYNPHTEWGATQNAVSHAKQALHRLHTTYTAWEFLRTVNTELCELYLAPEPFYSWWNPTVNLSYSRTVGVFWNANSVQEREQRDEFLAPYMLLENAVWVSEATHRMMSSQQAGAGEPVAGFTLPVLARTRWGVWEVFPVGDKQTPLYSVEGEGKWVECLKNTNPDLREKTRNEHFMKTLQSPRETEKMSEEFTRMVQTFRVHQTLRSKSLRDATRTRLLSVVEKLPEQSQCYTLAYIPNRASDTSTSFTTSRYTDGKRKHRMWAVVYRVPTPPGEAVNAVRDALPNAPSSFPDWDVTVVEGHIPAELDKNGNATFVKVSAPNLGSAEPLLFEGSQWLHANEHLFQDSDTTFFIAETQRATS